MIRHSSTILLVEDNVDDVELTKRAFAKSHIANEVVVAPDGQAALDYLKGTGSHAGRDPDVLPALVLLDLNLPLIDGLEVLREIRSDARTRRVPVVILTSSREERDRLAGYDLGANSYVRKPVDFTQFLDAAQSLGMYWLVLNQTPNSAG